jgi:predicted nucleic acid-binding protein
MAQRYVVDANATLSLFLRLPYSERSERWMQERRAEEAILTVPTLWEYECLTGFRRAVSLDLISSQEAEWMVKRLYALEFQTITPTLELHRAALHWAARINQSKAYDSQYLALAESLSAEFWTADKRLVRALEKLDINWIHAI